MYVSVKSLPNLVNSRGPARLISSHRVIPHLRNKSGEHSLYSLYYKYILPGSGRRPVHNVPGAVSPGPFIIEIQCILSCFQIALAIKVHIQLLLVVSAHSRSQRTPKLLQTPKTCNLSPFEKYYTFHFFFYQRMASYFPSYILSAMPSTI